MQTISVYNFVILKLKYKLHVAPESAPPHHIKIPGQATVSNLFCVFDKTREVANPVTTDTAPLGATSGIRCVTHRTASIFRVKVK